jgi:hypothetical protein
MTPFVVVNSEIYIHLLHMGKKSKNQFQYKTLVFKKKIKISKKTPFIHWFFVDSFIKIACYLMFMKQDHAFT